MAAYAHTNEIMNEFSCSKSTVTKCRRFIGENLERYGIYGNLGRLTNRYAFADAYKFREFKAPDLLPPFDPIELRRLMG